MREIEKNKISYLYFVLSILVILVHSINNTSIIQKLFSIDTGISQFAVPLFFMISGFLFFRNIYTNEDVINKLKRRVYSLVIPYLIWNVIYYIIYLIVKPGIGVSFVNLVEAAINHTYNPAFWFIFQLILLSLVSYVIFLVLKKDFHYYIAIIVISFFIAKNIDIPFINEDALIYYMVGALFSRFYNESKVSFISKKNFLIMIPIVILFFMLNRIMKEVITKNIDFVHIFTLSIVYLRLSVSFFIFYFVDLFFNYSAKVPDFLKNTFVLYAIHYMIVKALIIVNKYFMYKYMMPVNYIYPETIIFFLSPIICVIINYYFVKFMKDKANNIYKLLSGAR